MINISKCLFQGVFVQLVQANTPAALAGLRFGDQILQINGQSCAGWSSDNAHKELKNANPEKIILAVRDRYTCMHTHIIHRAFLQVSNTLHNDV